MCRAARSVLRTKGDSRPALRRLTIDEGKFRQMAELERAEVEIICPMHIFELGLHLTANVVAEPTITAYLRDAAHSTL